MALLVDARQAKKSAEGGDNNGKGRKPKAKAKGKSQPKAKAKAKAQPDSDVINRSSAAPSRGRRPMKRPAAALNDSLPDDEQAPKSRPLTLPHPLPEDEMMNLPATFARRAQPTSCSGLEKYCKIVQAFNHYIAPTVFSGCKTTAEDTPGEWVLLKLRPIYDHMMWQVADFS